MFKNKEVRTYTIKYILLVLVGAILLFFLMSHLSDTLDTAYYQELISSDREHQTLVETGRLSYLPSEYNNQVQQATRMLYVMTYLIFTLIAVAGYIIGLSLYRVPMRAISRIHKNSQQVLEGDYENIDFSTETEGDISQFYSIYTSMVTAIKQSKDKELKEKEFLQDLIADISHQLKTPLATLTIYQDLLSNPDIPEDKRQEIVKTMGDQLSRMEWLILSLLKLARLESGAIEFNATKQPLLPTLQMSVQNVAMLSNAKNQRVEVSCDPDIILTHDRDWLAEALTNILKNATEYAPESSTIELAVECSAVTTMIHITDHGKGIVKEDLNKIFKRFYRAKSDVNENSIGIGLSLSKGIVEGQGGDISVSSEPGQYTRFTVCFYHIYNKKDDH